MVDIVTSQNPILQNKPHFDGDRMAGSVPVWNSGKNIDKSSHSTMALSLSDSGMHKAGKAPTLSFGEVLDVINPLHHLPVVGSVYRSLSGDEISSVARIAGGTLYGGPLGGISSLVSAAIEEHSGTNSTTALAEGWKSDQPRYAFVEEERSAGLRRDRVEAEHQLAQKNDKDDTFKVASAPVESAKISQNDIFDVMEKQKREPVTRVSVEVAEAPKRAQQWNFNA